MCDPGDLGGKEKKKNICNLLSAQESKEKIVVA